MKNTVLPFALFGAMISPALVAQTKLEEVVVTASRTETPLRQVGASVAVLQREEIELRGYNSVAELMRHLAGISLTNSGGAGKQTSLRIRGEEGFRTLVMIDGVEVTDPTGTQATPQIEHLSNSNDIERIEVLRGPQGFSYGADAGGVVNIFTRQSKEGTAGQIAAEYGRYQSKKVNVFASQGSDLGDAFISISDQSTDGFNTRVEDSSGEKDGYENTTLHGKFGWNPNEAYRAQLVIRDVTSDSEFDQCFGTDACESAFDQTIARASLTYDGEKSQQVIGYSQTDVKRSSLANGITSFTTDGTIHKADYLRSISTQRSASLVYGLDVEREDVTTSEGKQIDRSQLGAFAEIQDNIDETIYLSAGIRYDDHDDFGDHVSVRLTSAYVLPLRTGAEMKLRTSLGTGFRSPSISELAYNDGPFAFGEAAETELREEKTRGIDVGVEFHGRTGALLDLTFFFQRIEDEIFFDLNQFSGYLQARGEIESTGFEVSVDYPLSRFVTIKSAFTYNDTEQRDGAQRIRRPEKHGDLGVHLQLLESRLTMIANIRAVRDSVDEVFGRGRVPLDDYEAIDLSANYRLSDKFSLFGRIENVTDEKYEEVTDYNVAGASAYAGARYDF